MLLKFKPMWDGHLGRVNMDRHQIELNSAKEPPIHLAPYRASPRAQEFEKHEINKKLAMDVIDKDQTEPAALIVFTAKKDGPLRICVDYGKLSAVTIQDSYSMPRMNKCINSLGDAMTFSTLDIKAATGKWKSRMKIATKQFLGFTMNYSVSF